MYKSINFSNSEKILTTYAKSLALFILLLLAYFVSSRGYDFSRLQLGYTIVIFGSVIFIARVFLILFVRRYRFMGYNYKTAIIIGDSLEAFKVNHYLQSDKSMGYKFQGFFFDGTEKYQKYKKGGLAEVQKYCKDFGIDEVFYSLSAGNERYLMELITFCDNNFIRLRLLPSLNILNGKQFNIEFYDRTPVLAFRKEPLEDTFNRVLKRSFD
ncbi:MAG: hypothetical protein K2Q22_03720, partial [Cytophagales bacterium]|nr:hypothetical protein [Cytophagales bacterium]